MAEPPEFWTFAVAHLIVFGFGTILTGLSWYAYRANGRPRSFLNSTVGFGILTFGGLVEPIYQLGLKGDYHLGGREMLAMQTIEGVLIGIGMGMLFYSIYCHNKGTQQTPNRTTESVHNPR